METVIYSFTAFCKEFGNGKFEVVQGRRFPSLVFTDASGEVTVVYFPRNEKRLSCIDYDAESDVIAQQIRDNFNNLRVLEGNRKDPETGEFTGETVYTLIASTKHAKKQLTSLVSAPKEDAYGIEQYIKRKRVKRFYHFTDRRNLQSIKQHGGLFSWYHCEKNGISISNPGGTPISRELDERYGLEDYVRLSFCDDHPMAYRKHKEGSSLVLLYVDIDVATFKDTLFADRNATSNSCEYGAGLDDLMKVDIQATQEHYVSRADEELFSLHQAECMVKTHIPLKYISNIDNPQEMTFGKERVPLIRSYDLMDVFD